MQIDPSLASEADAMRNGDIGLRGGACIPCNGALTYAATGLPSGIDIDPRT